MKVKGKVILVTGGGNGMGRELVLRLLEKGSRVIAADINPAALLETVQMAGERKDSLTALQVDITSKKAVEQLLGHSVAAWGHVDGVINNAGIIQPFKKVNDIGFDDIERVFDVNFLGTLYMIKAFLPHLLTRPEAHIVNVSSMGGFMPVAGQSVYGASKAAVKILSEGLASELSETAVGVTTAFPGAMFTDIKANSGLGREAGAGPEGHAENAAMPPSKAAAIIINGIEERKTRIFIGRDAKSMNVAYKFMPGVATKMLYGKMRDKL